MVDGVISDQQSPGQVWGQPLHSSLGTRPFQHPESRMLLSNSGVSSGALPLLSDQRHLLRLPTCRLHLPATPLLRALQMS